MAVERLRVWSGVLSLTLLSAALPGSSFGQEQEPGLTRRAPWVEMRELIVTASKRAETVQTAPLSLRAFGSEELGDRRLSRLSDLSQATPNLLADPTSNEHHLRIYMRGVGSDDRIATLDPGVGVYVDGVYHARTYALNLDLMDLERVEVLRGPQGTLYGRNTIGGAINLVTRKPGSRFGTELQIEAGSFDRLHTSVTADVPLLGDVLTARVALRSTHHGGYFENRFGGGTSDWSNDRGLQGRIQLRWLPSEDLESTLSIERTYKRTHPSGANPNSVCETNESPLCLAGISQQLLSPLTDGDAFEGSIDAGAQSAFSTTRAGRSENAIDSAGVTWTTMYDFGPSQLKWIAAVRRLELRETLDVDATALSYLELADHDANLQMSQEIQLNSSLLGGRLQTVSGLYYFQETNKNEQATFALSDRSITMNPLIMLLAGPLSSEGRTDQDVRSYAGYLSARYELLPRVVLNAGVRYSYDHKTFRRNEVNRDGSLRVATRDTEHFNDLSPTLGVQWQATDALLVYGKWSRGFRAGGFNGRSSQSNALTLLPFDPETAKVAELGLKTALWDDCLILNLAAFRSIYDDVQITTFTFDGAQFVNLINNAGKARVVGLEAELLARPIDGLLVSLGLGTTDADYLTYREPVLGGLGGTADASDRDFKNTPELTGNASVAYTFATPWSSSATVRADYSYRGQVYYNAANTDSIRQDPVGLLNLRLAWRNEDESIELGLWGRNVTNREWDIFGIDFNASQGFTTTYPAPPREVGIDLTVRY